MFKQYKLKNYRFRLIAYVVILCIIGVMVVGSAKPSVQNKQIVGLIGGLIAMVIISLIDYNTILKFHRPIYLLAVVLLAVIFIPGVGDNTGGATRWIQVTSSFKFQPSEFCKILLIVFFCRFFYEISGSAEYMEDPRLQPDSCRHSAVTDCKGTGSVYDDRNDNDFYYPLVCCRIKL